MKRCVFLAREILDIAWAIFKHLEVRRKYHSIGRVRYLALTVTLTVALISAPVICLTIDCDHGGMTTYSIYCY